MTLIRKLKNAIQQTFIDMSTDSLVSIPMVLAIISIGVAYLIVKGKYLGQPIEYIFIFSFFFFEGISGIPMIIRKDLPSFIKIKGITTGIGAVITGILMLFSGWGFALYIIILSLAKWSK